MKKIIYALVLPLAVVSGLIATLKMKLLKNQPQSHFLLQKGKLNGKNGRLPLGISCAHIQYYGATMPNEITK